jgi:hypothetical protein
MKIESNRCDKQEKNERYTDDLTEVILEKKEL